MNSDEYIEQKIRELGSERSVTFDQVAKNLSGLWSNVAELNHRILELEKDKNEINPIVVAVVEDSSQSDRWRDADSFKKWAKTGVKLQYDTFYDDEVEAWIITVVARKDDIHRLFSYPEISIIHIIATYPSACDNNRLDRIFK